MKRIWQSKTVWLNAAVIVVEAMLASLTFVHSEVPPVAFAVLNSLLVSVAGVANLYLRIYKTDTPIQTTPRQ